MVCLLCLFKFVFYLSYTFSYLFITVTQKNAQQADSILVPKYNTFKEVYASKEKTRKIMYLGGKKKQNKRNENFALRISQRDRQGNDIQMDSVVLSYVRGVLYSHNDTHRKCRNGKRVLIFLIIVIFFELCNNNTTKRETLALYTFFISQWKNAGNWKIFEKST